MEYRLLALDLDGTTTRDGAMPSPRVRKAIAAAVERGCHVVLATGRPFGSAFQYARVLDLTTPLICYQGALIKESYGDQRALLRVAMPVAPASEVVSFAEARHLNLTLYGDDHVYVASMIHPPEFYERWFGLPVAQAASLREAFDLVCAHAGSPLKGLFIGEPEDNDRLTPALQARFGGRLAVARSHDLFVEVHSLDSSKGVALAWLAAHLGVRQEETIAIGDSGNDVSMVQWAGMGIAMGNASADVLAVANWVAPPVSEDGVAAAIDRFVLMGEVKGRERGAA